MGTRNSGFSRQVIAIVLLCLFGLPGYGNDWAQWRGPNRDAICLETGLLKDWPGGGPLLTWKATGLGEGYSSISVLGDRLYTTGQKGDSTFVFALAAADGKIVWSAKLGHAGAPGSPKFEGTRSTPTVDGELVYAVGQYGEMVCLERSSGKERWRKDFTKDFAGERPEWGFSESPLIDGNKIIVTPGGSKGALVALHKENGMLIWQSKEFIDPAHYSSAIIGNIGGVRQYIQLTPSSVAGIAAADGKLLWKAPRIGKVAVIPTPVLRDRFVYVSSGYGVGCNLFKVTSDGGKFSAQEVYANKVMMNHHGGLIRIGDCVYGFSDSKGWTCQNLRTGEALWQEKGKVGKGCLLYAEGLFYLRQEDSPGTVAIIEASEKGYKEHGRFNPPDRSDKKSWSHPVIAGKKLYLRDQDVLLCYDLNAFSGTASN